MRTRAIRQMTDIAIFIIVVRDIVGFSLRTISNISLFSDTLTCISSSALYSESYHTYACLAMRLVTPLVTAYLVCTSFLVENFHCSGYDVYGPHGPSKQHAFQSSAAAAPIFE
jgi:hypothetical protein